ncbi:MAG: calcium-binding protein, partial [Dongiaceae bacterium]
IGYAEIIVGTSGNDVINGNGGYYDAIYGEDGDDVINGGYGFDHLRGGAGDDIVYGFDGNDRLTGGSGNDLLDGGNGVDLAIYGRAAAGVIVDLSAGEATDDGDGGHDTLISIEDVRGSAHADLITGDSGNNRILGRSGDDVLNGGLGDDLLWGQDGADTFAFDSFDEGNDFIFAFESSQDKLAFKDILDVGNDGSILDDVQAEIFSIVDPGAGFDVEITFNDGGILRLGGIGTGSIMDISDVVADPATQIVTF